jgi:hypothetical protein
MGREAPSAVHQVLVAEILPRQHPLDQAPELGHVLDPDLRMHERFSRRKAVMASQLSNIAVGQSMITSSAGIGRGLSGW